MATAITDKPVNAQQHKQGGELNAAAFVIRQLAEWKVERIYGVIGDAIFELLHELACQSQIRFIPCRHEGAAALMASAEAKLTGRVAVCMATSGPGMANLLNGLADAAADYAPVLAITGQVETRKLSTRTKQYIDQQQLISPIAYSSRLIVHADALPECLSEALMESLTVGRVTHISICKDVYAQKVTGTGVLPYPPHLHQPLLTPPEPIREAAKLMTNARRPVLYIGRGVQDCTDEVRQLAERLEAAVVTTLPARPLFPNDDPSYAGGLGQAGSEAAGILMAESDLIVTLGATWWPDEYAPSQAAVVQIDRIASNMGAAHPVRFCVVGDLPSVLPILLGELGPQQARAEWRARTKDVTRSWKRTIEAESQSPGTPMAPQLVMKIISGQAADDAVVAIDTGDHTLWFDRTFQTKRQDILVSGRWRTLGFALPAAIAAKLSYPERQVVAIAGDGGAVQTLLELQTAAQLGTAVTLVIIENGCYAMEKNRMVANGLKPLGSELANPDFARIAEACGCAAWRAETAGQLEQALKAALQLNRPALIQVKTSAAVVPHTK